MPTVSTGARRCHKSASMGNIGVLNEGNQELGGMVLCTVDGGRPVIGSITSVGDVYKVHRYHVVANGVWTPILIDSRPFEVEIPKRYIKKERIFFLTKGRKLPNRINQMLQIMLE